ncbi:MAG: CDP-alcohol phosphatidyltransferase family protein, partial [Candidatus Aminicenantes bacterium]|nr:CDP-alcohol phosphatidyltransferase family protein [Candidatus Aminicenantes bacterium]
MVNMSLGLLFTIPNLFSLTRVLLIPLFLAMLIRHNMMGALTVFFIAASTDFLDGIAARLLKQKSKLGALLDPLGDKLLMTSAVIALSLPSLSTPNVIPAWLTLTIIGRDLYIVTGVIILYKRIGQKTFPPTLSGKISTVCQMSVIILILFCNTQNMSPLYVSWLYYLTLVF